MKTTVIVFYNNLTTESFHIKSIYINKIVPAACEVKKISSLPQNQPIILLKTSIPDGAVIYSMEKNVNNITARKSIFMEGICPGYFA